MKSLNDAQLIRHLNEQQRGVFTTGDLHIAFEAPHPEGFVRRVRVLLNHGILRRFCRGWYVTEEFDLATLSQRLAPESFISFGTVLATNLITGTNPERHIVAVKTGRPRKYSCDGFIIEHVSIKEDLMFGFSDNNGIQYANTERAVIDTLYFHLRGRRYPFDIYSDIALEKLDKKRLLQYVRRFRNPKFVAFAKEVLEIQ